jgi:hypothetical protein
MKIELNIDDIFARGEGVSLESEIKAEIVDRIIEHYGATIKRNIEDFTAAEVRKVIQVRVAEQLPAAISGFMDMEYTPVARYGEKSEPTTLAKELHKTLVEQMVYKPTTYSSDKNAFTKAADEAVGKKMTEFQKEWTRVIDAQFVAEAMKYATESLAKRLGVKAA